MKSDSFCSLKWCQQKSGALVQQACSKKGKKKKQKTERRKKKKRKKSGTSPMAKPVSPCRSCACSTQTIDSTETSYNYTRRTEKQTKVRLLPLSFEKRGSKTKTTNSEQRKSSPVRRCVCVLFLFFISLHRAAEDAQPSACPRHQGYR